MPKPAQAPSPLVPSAAAEVSPPRPTRCAANATTSKTARRPHSRPTRPSPSSPATPRHLARRVIDDVNAGRNGPADLNGTGKQRPSLSDFIGALTGNRPFTDRELIDRLSPCVRLNPKRATAAHNVHHVVNADSRFRRHERGVYTRVHHG